MTISAYQLLQSHGFQLMAGRQRVEVLAKMGQPIKMIDTEGNTFSVVITQGHVRIDDPIQDLYPPIMVERSHIAPVSVTTVAGKKLELRPILMNWVPSQDHGDWMRFIGHHVPGSALPEIDQRRLQVYMQQHQTEALTDGTGIYTLAGDSLAHCDPLNR
ncbi:hypothetical protein IYR97_23370 (plasmid) [Pseudomonas fulva]|uniref:Uncharacterized protein n=3 Tax=Pseudomonas TaxID=286 RepID=A0A1X0ZNB2_PSEPU|nr:MULTISPECIES: hypothetical protein [Pseudomonas]MCT8164005.1 hypothetical protein [Pseudomonas sp. HD6422]MCT8183007.1 hypothetical protein [Pseudomonas sp. HD6421]MDH1930491.1 hypothetical protein [Pseudomonas sp. GD03696]MDM1711722.1 hypothetical protein [Pseudomonas sp. 165]ORL48621.1 hypothetical protein B7H18_26025 [Pseudomonas putida]